MRPLCRAPDSPALLQVWRVYLPPAVKHFVKNLALLDVSEKRRADSFHFERDRQRFVASHAALRLILGQVLSVQPQDIAYALQPGGKPQLSGFLSGSQIQFNLSHSGQWALIAVSTEDSQISLGVDLEAFDLGSKPPVDVIPSFSPGEQHALKDLEGQELTIAFYRCWTRKEALVKALGTGIGDGLALFTVSVGEAAKLIDSQHPALEPAQWVMTSLDHAGAYAGALAVKGGNGLQPLEREWVWNSER
jgi:4'-phosphopantetheinyl transferase